MNTKTKKDWLLAINSTLCFALIIGSYYVLKPARIDLVVTTWGIRNLPLASGINVIALLLIAHAYNSAANRARPLTLAVATITAGAVVLCCLLLCLLYPSKVTAVAFLVGGSAVNLFAVATFWSLANSLHGTEDGKRFYGLIGAGGPIGGIAGSFASQFIIGNFGTNVLLLISAGVLLLATPFAILAALSSRPVESKSTTVSASSATNSIRVILRSPRARSICLIVVLSTLTSGILGWIFNAMARGIGEESGTSMALVLARAYIHLNWITLILQLCCVPTCLRFLGLRGSLMVTPFFAFICAIVLLTQVSQNYVMLSCIMFLSMTYTTQQCSKELLYTEQSDDTIFKAKAFIDTAFFRFGALIGSLLVWVLVNPMQQSVRGLVPLILAAATVWVVVSYRSTVTRDFPVSKTEAV